MRTPREVGALGDHDGRRQLDGRRVAGILAGDDLVEARVVADGLRQRADLVEARGEGDDPVAGDRAVGRAQADDAAERGRLLHRAARVGAERPGREPAGDRRRRAAGRAARDALGVPGVPGRAVGGVLGGRAHGELVQVRLAEDGQAGRLAARGDRRVEDRRVADEDLRARRRRDALRRDHVLVRDRDAVPALAGDVQVGVQLRVAGLDRLEVGAGELVAGDLAALEQPGGLLGGEPQGVDHGHVSCGRLRGHPVPPPAVSVTRKSARVARGTCREWDNVTRRPPGRGTGRRRGPARSPAPRRAGARAAARPRPTR